MAVHLESGQHLGDYRILAPIGAGGMGEVYRARDTRLDRDVAIKVLPAEVATDPARRARFEREAKAIAALNHENIVTIHTIGEEGDVHYLAMELVEGETLDRRIPAGGLPTEALLNLAVPVLAALSAAHAKGIVHRDLKPSNVMVTHDGKVKVLDFGLAKLAHALEEADDETIADQTVTVDAMMQTREGAVVGTVPYMSPEQLSGRAVGPASDLFSVGILLYEMATGKRPFQGKSSPQLISSILTGTPAPVGELKPALPDRLGELIGECLEKDPVNRPSGAEQLRRDLEALRSSASMPATMTAADPKAGGYGKRLGIAAAIALVAVVAAVVVGWKTLAPQPPRATGEMLRLAVIPFAAEGGEQATLISSGLHDEISRRLAGLRALSVIPVGSTATYRGTDRTSVDIGRELEVDYIVAGSVVGDASRLRVQPELIRVSDGEPLWSGGYDVASDDLLTLQSEISGQIVRELGIAFSEKESERLRMRSTDNPVAYEAYLRGVEAQPHSHDSEAEYRRALRLFEQAVKLDPEFALAWVSVAHNHLQIYWLGYDRTAARLKMSSDALDEAEKRAPGLADIRLQRGYLHYHGSLDFDKALAELSLAAEDIPNDPELIRTIGYIWRRQGLFEQALENLERARELTPFEPYQNVELAYTRLLVDDYAELFDEIEAARTHDPDYDWAYMLSAYAYWHRGREGDLDRARAELARHPDPRDDYPAWFRILQHWYDRDFETAQSRIANLSVPYIKLQSHIAPRDQLAGFTFLMQGDPESARPRFEKALALLEGMTEELPDDHRLLSSLGLTHAALGDKEEAIRLGKRAIEIYPVEQDMLMGPDRLWDMAKIYILVGEHDAALDQIAYLLSLRTHYSAAMLANDPVLDPVREHPRFASLMR